MLKYLREVGPAQGVTLEMENSYGLTPIVYAMMNNQVYTFIYLYFKMSCYLSSERASWTITQMIKQQTDRTEILQLLFHEETLSDAVAQAALSASVENSNSDTLKCTLKHLYCNNKLYEGQLRVLLG